MDEVFDHELLVLAISLLVAFEAVALFEDEDAQNLKAHIEEQRRLCRSPESPDRQDTCHLDCVLMPYFWQPLSQAIPNDSSGFL